MYGEFVDRTQYARDQLEYSLKDDHNELVKEVKAIGITAIRKQIDKVQF